MSTNLTLFSNPPLTKRSSMAAVLECIFADENLPLKKRSNIRWALRTVAKACGRRLDTLIANPPELTKQLDQITAAMVGLTEGGWVNARSLTGFAFRHVGLTKPLARPRQPFAPAWTVLMASMEQKHDQIGLSRLARYCTGCSIDPDDVTDAVFDAFLKEITEEALIRQPKKVHRRAAVIWNAMASTTRNWPTQSITIPSYSKVYFKGWDAFPATLQADVEAHLRSLDGSSPLERKGLKPGSIKTRRQQLGAYLSALVLQGENIADLRTLADAVDPRRVKIGLEFFLGRAKDQSKVQAYEIANLLLSIARHWVKIGPEGITTLQKYCKLLKNDRIMGPKTRTRLRQFNDEQAIQQLFALPAMLVTKVKQRVGKPTQADALLVQTAVAIELLLMVPIRRHNLVALDLDAHIVRPRSGHAHLFIPDDQVKNGVEINAVLPASLVRILDLYVERYRPILDPSESSSWLFPGLPGRHKSRERFACQISDTIKEQIGLLVNVHLFRGIAAKVYLDRNPGGYGVVKLLHGHKSLETTIRSYCGLEGRSAIAHYDQVILNAREAIAPVSIRKRHREVA